MEVETGEIVSLIGSNGAGKTTLLNTIAGVAKASRGTVTFKGKDIYQLPLSYDDKAEDQHFPRGQRSIPRTDSGGKLAFGSLHSKG